MRADVVTLLTLADDVAGFAREVHEATDPNGPRGRKVTLAELGELAAAAARLVAHIATMIVKAKATKA